MFKSLVELLRGQLFLTRDVQENKEAIARLRRQFDEIADVVSKLQSEVQSLRESERHEREKTLLKLENALLKLERQLPASKESRKTK